MANEVPRNKIAQAMIIHLVTSISMDTETFPNLDFVRNATSWADVEALPDDAPLCRSYLKYTRDVFEGALPNLKGQPGVADDAHSLTRSGARILNLAAEWDDAPPHPPLQIVSAMLDQLKVIATS